MAAERLKRVLWWTTGALVALTPLLMFPPGKDLFRLPKRAFLATGSTVLAALVLIGLAGGQIRFVRERLRTAPMMLIGAALGWTLLCSLSSTNRTLSLAALTIACAYALFFVVASSLIADRSARTLVLVFVPAALNAALITMQENGLQPFELQELRYDPHLASTGFLGNPNFVGTFLAGPCLAALALALVSRGRGRVIAAALSLLFFVGILSSQTLTAVLALLGAIAVLAMVVSWRRAIVALAALALLLTIVATLYAPMRSRTTRLIDRLAARDYNALLTNRLTPFAAAVEITLQHPIAGSGPGTFGFNYFDAKVTVDRKYPSLMKSAESMSWNFSFSEVHNDHLEIASETGLVGYAIFLWGLVILARISFRPPAANADPRGEFARILSLPLAVLFGLLTLAQFPLQLPASALAYLFLAACCVTWGNPQDSAVMEFQDGSPGRGIRTGAIALVAAIATTWTIYTFGVQPLRCNATLRQLEETTTRAMSSGPYDAAPLAREALDRCDASLARCRRKLEFLMVRAANLRLLSRQAEAIETYRKAAALEKRPEILFQLAETLFESGQEERSIEPFVEACSFQPSLLNEVPATIRERVAARLKP